MKKNVNYFVIIVTLIIMISIYGLSYNVDHSNKSYYAQKGILNLENWEMASEHIITLKGEWLFFPSQLRQDINPKSLTVYQQVPHYWESDTYLNSPYGYGTYQLTLTGLEPFQVYSIHIIDEVTAYTLYANHILIASNGLVSDLPEMYKPGWKPEFAVFKADDMGSVKLEMEIANFDYYRGGFWNSPRIGDVDKMVSAISREKAIELFLFTTILIMGFINLAFFITNKNDKLTLYFALFCFSMSFRTILIGQRLISDILPNVNWHFLVRMEYFLGYLLLPLFGLFISQLFDEAKIMVVLKRFFCYFIVLISVATFVFPNKIYTFILEPYKWMAFILALYFLYLVYGAIRKQYQGAALMFIAIIGLIISILKEILIGGVFSWMPFGTLNFILCFSLLTFQKFITIIKKNEILEAEIIRDPLTGLYNRTYLMTIEDEYFNTGNHSKYLMFLDLDSFKAINDNYGHKIGDFILQEAGERFKSIIRKTDVICRYGGDEFIIILTAENDDEVHNIAKRIIEITRQPYNKDELSYYVGVSIGITKCEGNIHNIDHLIKRSDEAMYEAKNRGSNQYVFYTS